MNILNPSQTLIEDWEVKFTRERRYGAHVCVINVTHPVIVSTRGTGATVEAARIDAIMHTAAGYIDAGGVFYEDSDWQVSDETLEFMSKIINRERRRRRQADAKEAEAKR